MTNNLSYSNKKAAQYDRRLILYKQQINELQKLVRDQGKFVEYLKLVVSIQERDLEAMERKLAPFAMEMATASAMDSATTSKPCSSVENQKQPTPLSLQSIDTNREYEKGLQSPEEYTSV